MGRELPFRRRGGKAPDLADAPPAMLDEIAQAALDALDRLGPEPMEVRFHGGPLDGTDHQATFPPVPAPGGVYRWRGQLELIWEEEAPVTGPPDDESGR